MSFPLWPNNNVGSLYKVYGSSLEHLSSQPLWCTIFWFPHCLFFVGLNFCIRFAMIAAQAVPGLVRPAPKIGFHTPNGHLCRPKSKSLIFRPILLPESSKHLGFGASLDIIHGGGKKLQTQTSNCRVVCPRAVSDCRNSEPCLDPEVSQSVLGIILGGGAGTRLYPLTKKRAKPAVPLAANYRLIDIPISNCINSNITKVYVLTQFNSASLNRHISRAYDGNIANYRNEGFVEVLAAQQSPENPNWFQGTADAVRHYLWLFDEHPVMEFLILAGDHLYRMDYRDFIQTHRETHADITVAAVTVDEKRAGSLGLMKIDSKGRIVEFAEKPKGEKLKAMAADTSIIGLKEERAKEMPYIASMGIYVISKEVMKKLLNEEFSQANDFGSEVIPNATSIGMRVQAHLFDGYWQDIGTIEAFYHANLGITKNPVPDFSFYDRSSPIYTQKRFLPPSKMLGVNVINSVIGEGCILKNCMINHSVVGLRSWIEDGAIIEDSLLMGADYYETDEERSSIVEKGGVPIGIGKKTLVRRAIIDKNVRIGYNVKIINANNVEEAAREVDGYYIRSGIVTVIKDALIPNGTTI